MYRPGNIVTNQEDLDEAVRIAGAGDIIKISSPRGIGPLTLDSRRQIYAEILGESVVSVWGTVRVSAWDKARVVARERADVMSYDNTYVRAGESATVTANGRSFVLANEQSRVTSFNHAHVAAYGKAAVHTLENSTAVLWGHATGTFAGNSCAVLHDFSSGVAINNAQATAFGASTVLAKDRARVTAYGYAVARAVGPSAIATIRDPLPAEALRNLDLNHWTAWVQFHNVHVEGGLVTAYKAVDDNLEAGHSYITTRYDIGTTVTARDWQQSNSCGGGLHLSPSPMMAAIYSAYRSTRFLKCTALVTDVDVVEGNNTLGPKFKARSVNVIGEVDARGLEI